MKRETVRNGLFGAAIFTIVIIFLQLIGFTVIASGMIAKLFGGSSLGIPAVSNFVIFMTLLGLWNGSAAAKPRSTSSWRDALLSGLVAGAVTGALVGLFGLLIGSLYAGGVDMRAYLSALSADSVRLFLYISAFDFGAPVQLGPISTHAGVLTGALTHLGLLTLTGVLGAGIAYFLRGKHIFASLSGGSRKLTGSLSAQPQVGRIIGSRFTRYGLILLGLVLLFLMPSQLGPYWNYIMGTVGIYVLLGLGLNIIVGLSGQLVLGYVAFFAVGAYVFALVTSPFPHNLQWPFWLALLFSVAAATLTGILLGLPILNLRGDYLAIVTLGFGEIIRILIRSDLFTPITDGPRGVRNIAQPSLFGRAFSSDVEFMYLILVAVILLIFITQRLQSSVTGRAWVSLREDETVAQASGVSPFKYKLLALALGAAFAGLAGVLFASRNQFTGPEDHVLMVSINVLCLVIVGGMGSIPGIILGAFALKGLPEILRDFESYRMLAFGMLLVVMMVMRPEGLWPAARHRMELSESKQEDEAGAAGGLEVKVAP